MQTNGWASASYSRTVLETDRCRIWASRLKLAGGFDLAAVTTANKNARIIRALLTRSDAIGPRDGRRDHGGSSAAGAYLSLRRTRKGSSIHTFGQRLSGGARSSWPTQVRQRFRLAGILLRLPSFRIDENILRLHKTPAMLLDIRNEEVNQLAKKLAARKHLNKAEAVRVALENEPRRLEDTLPLRESLRPAAAVNKQKFEFANKKKSSSRAVRSRRSIQRFKDDEPA